MKAILDLDLCVQFTLSAVGEKHLPTGRGEVLWHQLWDAAQNAVGELRYGQQMQELHAQRNLAQHCATVPSEESVREALVVVERFLDWIVEKAFGSRLDDLGVWSFIQADAAREALETGAAGLRAGIPEVAIAAAQLTHDAIGDKIAKNAQPHTHHDEHHVMIALRELTGSSLDRSGLRSEEKGNLKRVFEAILRRLGALERNLVSASLGMPLDQELKYKSDLRGHGVMQMESGLIRGGSRATTPEEQGARVKIATFGLQHVSQLCLLIEAVVPHALRAVKSSLAGDLRRFWEKLEAEADSPDSQDQK
ncbi:hypothetical protein ACFL6C_07705 [Myxococcota bacterium]